jgi:predicted dehydrogenase
MDNILGVGILGCGNISPTYFELAPMFKNIEIRACADINPSAAETRADEYGVRCETISGLLGANDIDIIVNLTVPDVHFTVTRQILAAGKHAYSEKPLVLSLGEGRELIALADDKGLKVGCAPDTFLGGAHQLARETIDAGEIGKITSGTCHLMSHGMEMWHPNPAFFFQPGGGPILDMGPYYIANLVNLIGPVKRVAALSSMATTTRTITSEPLNGTKIPVRTPTNIHALLEFESGATITLTASWDVWAHQHNNIELYGTEGSIILPDPNHFGGEVKVTKTDGELHPLEDWNHPFGVINQDTHANYRAAGLADMAHAILEGREARCSIDRALHGVDVMLSILKSGEIGAFVDIQTSCTRPEALGNEDARALLK